ncbi:MAG: NADH-quinone oxidoreductase subunit D [Candidatus Cloacimonetes bacterium]|nr:NADH-quinone oxidoreductase subunit D [Candidatus Cloacimonadota bacterium]
MNDKYPPIVDGKSVYDLDSQKYLKMWQGPQHPGVTGNMSLELDISGDQIIKCNTHVGYLHRGFEKLMERRRYINCFPIVCRICVPEPDTNEYLFAAATEELLGVEIPERAKWLRTLDLELSRLASFFMWIGGQSGAFGSGTVAQWSIAYRDYVLDLFEELTGARIYHMYMIPGGVRGGLPEGWIQHAEKVLDGASKLLDEIYYVTFHNSVFKSRAKGLGIITPDLIDRFGVVGPNVRGSGIARDLRKDSPYLVYDQLDFNIETETAGDTYARTLVRWKEMHQSISLIRQIIMLMPKSGPLYTTLPNVLHLKVPAGETYVKAESTRGEYGYYMVSDGSEFPRKVTVRGPSYSHGMALLEHLAVGVNIADTHGLMISLHTYPPEIER